MEINREVNKPNASFDAIAKLLAIDPAMTARVLKIVNSPFYGLSRKVENIRHALTLLGLKTFQRVVLTAALHDVLIGSDKEHQEELSLFWNYTMVVAKITEYLVVRSPMFVDLVTPEQAHLAGLFHDCAVPLFVRKYPGYQEHMAKVKADNLQVFAYEEDNFSANHWAMGALMARSWFVPESVCQAIRFHHLSKLDSSHVSEMEALEILPLFELLRLGDLLGGNLMNEKGFEVTGCYSSEEEFLANINLDQAELEELKQEVRDAVQL
ncbi:MAG: HDOD domain-containing protein [Magnetococcales bacterium]|nr:HDOD domain-containing protein [Magnetococcales bacterium]